MSNHSCEMFLGALSPSTLTQLQQYTPKNILYKHGSALNDKSKWCAVSCTMPRCGLLGVHYMVATSGTVCDSHFRYYMW